MGELLEAGTWCRQRWCRADAAKTAEHFDGDGCSCHGAETAGDEPRANEAAEGFLFPTSPAPLPSGPPRAGAHEQRFTMLTAKASRLRAFACRTCGVQTRRMIEAPSMFFRCEECAAADRWPPARRQA